MKKIDAVLLKVLLLGLPFLLIAAVILYFYGGPQSLYLTGYKKILSDIGGLIFALWTLIAVYLCIRLVASRYFRERVLSRMAHIKERDERENVLSGQAARSVFLISLAVLITLFFLSCFQLSFYRLPESEAIDGKTGILSMGFSFSVTNEIRCDTVSTERKNIFSYNGLPFSASVLLLGLIFWHLISYNIIMRRLLK